MEFKRYLTENNIALGFFLVAAVISVARGYSHVLLVGLAVGLMIIGAMPKQHALAYMMGALAMVGAQRYQRITEGFTDVSGGEEKKEEAEAEEVAEDGEEKEVVKPDPVALAKEKKDAEKFSGGKKPMLPDNATRREPLELGKPYKLPSENDDKGYHMDAGTTFLNAYKALKPDQIAAMTRDTQELLATQKSLVGMLESFGPLMKDMKSITGIFGGN
jgi:hypothetical protein